MREPKLSEKEDPREELRGFAIDIIYLSKPEKEEEFTLKLFYQ